jgi:multisubunit Na+/H+ antiporter MnhF subunit
MNFWEYAATGFLILLFPVGIAVSFGRAMERLAALQLAAVGGTMVMLLLSQGWGQESFYDEAFALALLSVAAGFTFAHVHERWL